MTSRAEIFDQIAFERHVQDMQWGGPKHDDQHSVEAWTEYITKQTNLADKCGDTKLLGARIRFVKAAALAVAAIESIDRRLGPSGEAGEEKGNG